MSCTPHTLLLAVAGFVSGLLLGFLFRNSDAERDQAIRYGYRHWLLRALYSPIWSLGGFLLLVIFIGLLFFILWFPPYLLGVFPVCGDNSYAHKGSLIGGVFLGWYLR